MNMLPESRPHHGSVPVWPQGGSIDLDHGNSRVSVVGQTIRAKSMEIVVLMEYRGVVM